MEKFKILVELTFYPKEIIGRDRKYSNNYRPAFKIREDMFNSGQINFIDRMEVSSGESHVRAFVVFPYKQLLINSIHKGKIFTFGEGTKVLGEGIVIKK